MPGLVLYGRRLLAPAAPRNSPRHQVDNPGQGGEGWREGGGGDLQQQPRPEAPAGPPGGQLRCPHRHLHPHPAGPGQSLIGRQPSRYSPLIGSSCATCRSLS